MLDLLELEVLERRQLELAHQLHALDVGGVTLFDQIPLTIALTMMFLNVSVEEGWNLFLNRTTLNFSITKVILNGTPVIGIAKCVYSTA